MSDAVDTIAEEISTRPALSRAVIVVLAAMIAAGSAVVMSWVRAANAAALTRLDVMEDDVDELQRRRAADDAATTEWRARVLDSLDQQTEALHRVADDLDRLKPGGDE